jgi:bacterioferritin (cytochrome b1)
LNLGAAGSKSPTADTLVVGARGGGNAVNDLLGADGMDPNLEAQLLEVVEEYEEKLEKERARSLNLQMDLDRAKKLCKERAEDLSDLERYLNEMRDELATSEVVDDQILVTPEFADKLINGAPKVSPVNLIDEQLLIQERKRFRNELSEKDEHIDQLKQAVRMLESVGEAEFGRTSAVFPGGHLDPLVSARGFIPTTARGSRQSTMMGRSSVTAFAIPMTARGGAPPMTARGGGGEQSRLQLDMLRGELENTRSDCMTLRDRLDTVTKEKDAIASAKAHNVGADTEELQGMIDVLRGEVKEAEKKLSDEEDSKVQVLKERDNLRSRISQLEEEISELKGHAESVATEKESEHSSMSQQKQLLRTMLGGNRNVMLTECADGLRETVHVLEERLKKKVDELNETRLALQITKKQLQSMNIEPEVDRMLFKTVEREDGKKPLLSQVEAILDNSDLNIISTCKEAELRIVHAKLEQRERSFLATAHELLKLSEYIADVRAVVQSKAPELALPIIDLRSLHDICSTPESILNGSAISQRDADSLERQRRENLSVDPVDPTRAQLESVLQLMKALRKQNAMLHTVVMERSALLKHYAWLVVDSRILPRGTDLKAIVGDVATELRLAFAERDEEIFLKDQAVMQRSLQLVVVEEALATLHSQLTNANMTPSRPATKFALSAAETRQQTEEEIELRG